MSAFSFLGSKSNLRQTRKQRQRSKWAKSILNLEALETRTLPSTLTFVATNFDFPDFANEPVATFAAIPQFYTMGGSRTLTSVEIISSIEVDASLSGSDNYSGSRLLSLRFACNPEGVTDNSQGWRPASGRNPWLAFQKTVNQAPTARPKRAAAQACVVFRAQDSIS
jgi:hypothetical protein